MTSTHDEPRTMPGLSRQGCRVLVVLIASIMGA